MFEAPWVDGGSSDSSDSTNDNVSLADIMATIHYHNLPMVITDETRYWQLENLRGEGKGDFVRDDLWRYETARGVVYGRPTREPGVWRYENENPMTDYSRT
jgi:hypothetical protein